MARHEQVTKQADSKGRITLGKAFANRVVLVEERGDSIVLRRGQIIPESEAWLYKNDAALESVRNGLRQARKGKLVDGPDLKAAKKLADQLQDD